MLSGSFQNLLNMGGMPSGLNNAVAGYGYGADIDDAGFRMSPMSQSQKKAIEDAKNSGKDFSIPADILEQFNKSRTNPGGGLVNIPGMAIGNMQGLAAQGQGDLIAYPGLGSRQGGFNIMNPFTYGNMNRAVEGTRAGDENIQYSDSPAGQVGEAANERNRLLKQLLEGS